MKKILLLALPLMAMCAVSCEKNDGNDGQKLVKEISWLEDGRIPNQFVFEYDENARVINIAVLTGGITMENISITYNDDTITEKYSSINNNTGEWEEDSYAICHYLNNDGYLFRSENVENGEVSMSTIYKYSGNQLKNVTYYDSDGIKQLSYEYEWQNGNIVREYECEWRNGDIVRENDYEIQYLSNENKMNINWMNYSTSVFWPAGIKFQGTYSKHWMSGYYRTDWWTNRTYEFDADGYATKIRDINEYRTVEYNIKYY